MANSSNLMPIELLNARRTREERSENAKKAGKASGEARNQKANFKKALNLLLTAQVETEWTEQLSGKRLALLPAPPLRTVRDSFPSYGSSLS